MTNEPKLVKYVMGQYDAITAMCLVKHYVTALADGGDLYDEVIKFAERNPEFVLWVIKELGFLVASDGTRSYSNRLVFRLREIEDKKWDVGTKRIYTRLSLLFKLEEEAA